MEVASRWEFIYDSINGINEPGVCEWVKDESAEDGELGPLIEQIYGARNRLCEKTGLNPDTDEDFEQLISGFERLSRACGKLMYYYGCQDGIRTE